MKMTKFLQYFESSVKFRKEPFSAKYIEVYINKETILPAFHYFFFHKNVLHNSDVITFLLIAM